MFQVVWKPNPLFKKKKSDNYSWKEGVEYKSGFHASLYISLKNFHSLQQCLIKPVTYIDVFLLFHLATVLWTWQYGGHLPVCWRDVTLQSQSHRGKGKIFYPKTTGNIESYKRFSKSFCRAKSFVKEDKSTRRRHSYPDWNETSTSAGKSNDTVFFLQWCLPGIWLSSLMTIS